MIPSQLHSLIVFFGGLGLFLSSVNRIGVHSVQLGGRRLRQTLARHTSNRALSPLAGTALGALVQSASGVTAILVGLVVAGVVNIPSALSMMLWANIGSSALVLVASIDMQLLGLAVLGIAGIWLYFDQSGPEPRRAALEALFTLSLLLLGIGLMHTGTEGLSGGDGIRQDPAAVSVANDIKLWIVQIAGASALLGLVFGALAAAVTQSASGTAITIMAAFQAGLMPFAAAEMVVTGAVLGSGLSAFVLGLVARRGSQRLLQIFQGLTKVIGMVLLLALLQLERIFDLTLIGSLIAWISATPNRQLALLYLASESTPLLVHALAGRWVGRALDVLAPPAPGESLAHPRFIYPEAVNDPELALLLATREQQRVAQLLPGTLPEGTPPPEAADIPPAQVGAIGVRLAAEIGMFLASVAGSPLAREQVDLLANLQSRNEVLRNLHETLSDLTRTIQEARPHPTAAALANALAEGLGALLLCVDDAAQSEDRFDIDLLLQLSSDRGDVVDGMRRRVIGAEDRSDPASQQSVYTMTSLFERTVWLIQRYANHLKSTPVKV
jgi:phosphate:Na+ symporter